MKSVIVVIVLFLSFFDACGQLYNPNFWCYQGIAYMPLPNGYYYGWVNGGFPQGEGYAYVYQPGMGWVSYHGNFDRGVVHGLGELVCSAGYICGTWNHGQFVSQTYVQPAQMQQTVSNVYNNYSTYVQPQSNYQANVALPSHTTITQIDSDSELGRELLGKIGR